MQSVETDTSYNSFVACIDEMSHVTTNKLSFGKREVHVRMIRTILVNQYWPRGYKTFFHAQLS